MCCQSQTSSGKLTMQSSNCHRLTCNTLAHPAAWHSTNTCVSPLSFILCLVQECLSKDMAPGHLHTHHSIS